MGYDVTAQLSLGRFPVHVEPTETLYAVKAKLRTTIPQLLQVNFKAFRFFVNGAFLTDDTKTVADWGIKDGDVLHLVKKTTCPNAAVDTEKPADE